jgi:DNA repair exonuclease SbcCD ATPase subunit
MVKASRVKSVSLLIICSVFKPKLKILPFLHTQIIFATGPKDGNIRNREFTGANDQENLKNLKKQTKIRKELSKQTMDAVEGNSLICDLSHSLFAYEGWLPEEQLPDNVYKQARIALFKEGREPKLKEYIKTAQGELSEAQEELSKAQEELSEAQGKLSKAEESVQTAAQRLQTAQGELSKAKESVQTAKQKCSKNVRTNAGMGALLATIAVATYKYNSTFTNPLFPIVGGLAGVVGGVYFLLSASIWPDANCLP